ncbi:hypothetical protein COHA_006656 [Chlorella ohadii]|uniref:Uncharacterized protein n=1 Tax=Chlorella ohadii TaxID=2649997 RepID=A0AAD5DNK2_9CHLO|nr:hypothetical protein COHA_006656 [Chlorella ohadii]
MVLCPRLAGVAPCTAHSMASCAPLSAAAQQLLNGSTLFTLLASTSTPGTLAQLRHMQRDLGPHRVFLTFDDTNERWTHTPAQRLTARRNSNAPHEALPPVLLFNRSEADAVAGRLAGKGGQNYYEVPAIALLYRYLEGRATFDHGDVRCKGHFAECLASTVAQPQDVLCTWSWSQQQQPEWDKWDRLAGTLNKVPAAQRRSCFAPLLRLSRRAMRQISQQMGRSAGYMELLYGTLAVARNLSIDVIPESAIAYMTTGYHLPDAELDMRFAAPCADNRIYHPIKDCGSLHC